MDRPGRISPRSVASTPAPAAVSARRCAHRALRQLNGTQSVLLTTILDVYLQELWLTRSLHTCPGPRLAPRYSSRVGTLEPGPGREQDLTLQTTGNDASSDLEVGAER